MASNHRGFEMTLALPSERNATRGAKPQRLTRAQRTAILKALADPKRFELLEKIARSLCPLGCSQAHEARGGIRR